MGQFFSQEYKPSGIPSVGDPYIALLKFNLKNLNSKSMDRILAVNYAGYGNYAKSLMVDQRNNVILAGFFRSSMTLRNSFLMKL